MSADPDQEFRDRLHERRIAKAREDMVAARPEDRRAKWEIMRDLVLSRSPEQVERMEIAKGLRQVDEH